MEGHYGNMINQISRRTPCGVTWLGETVLSKNNDCVFLRLQADSCRGTLHRGTRREMVPSTPDGYVKVDGANRIPH